MRVPDEDEDTEAESAVFWRFLGPDNEANEDDEEDEDEEERASVKRVAVPPTVDSSVTLVLVDVPLPVCVVSKSSAAVVPPTVNSSVTLVLVDVAVPVCVGSLTSTGQF
jgi:hypothetical protein